MTAALVTAALRAHRFNVSSEEELQRGIAAALAAHGIENEREVVLTPRDRIDFMVGAVGVEVKIGGGISALTRQLLRYAQVERVSELVVVSTRMQLSAQVPRLLNGKPVSAVTIMGGLA